MHPLWLLAASPTPPPTSGGGMDPSWIVALIALITAVAACVAWAMRWAWRILKRITQFLDDYFGQPARDGVPGKPGVMSRLASVEQMVTQVVNETQPDHGHSLRDVVHQVADDVAGIKQEQTSMRSRMELWEQQRAGREEGK